MIEGGGAKTCALLQRRRQATRLPLPDNAATPPPGFESAALRRCRCDVVAADLFQRLGATVTLIGADTQSRSIGNHATPCSSGSFSSA